MNYTPLELAENYINNTGVSVFLTGKAGTGKTTFLRKIYSSTNKRCIVVAPTGVAAINANGVTIHSFFQLPFSPYLPSIKNYVSEYSLQENKRMIRKEKLDIIRTLDLLIIDEISMVRADLLDAIDYTLRRYRHTSRPFGGVQLLMIGDLHQLPPVVKDDEWQLMKQVYPSPFFFNSLALQQVNFITIELTTIFRQTDKTFIDLLNNIRQNKFDDTTLDLLNTRYQPNFSPADDEGYIRLTTHNHQAQTINTQKLENIDNEEHSFKAIIEGNFPEYSYPTDETLTLKEGAQIMFVRNDSSPEKRYYNGKIAIITLITDNKIEVKDENDNIITIERDKWENIKYVINKDTKNIEPIVDGTFTQFPIKLAWAITVHKSQGLTFEKAIIDVGSAFTYGQVYVALSRCKTFDGLVLSSKITPYCSFNNNEIETFNKQIPSTQYLEENLNVAQNTFYMENLFELFDFSSLRNSANELESIFITNLNKLYPQETNLFTNITKELNINIISIAERFKSQITKILNDNNCNITDPLLNERVNKACNYFTPLLKNIKDKITPLICLEIENKETEKSYKRATDTLGESLEIKIATLSASTPFFDVEKYIKAKNDSLLSKEKKAKKETKTKTITIATSNSYTTELIDILKNWRSERAYELDKPAFFVLTQSTLLEIAKNMPLTKEELMNISGFGKKKYEDFGNEILEIITDFCSAYKIERQQKEINIEEKSEKKVNTYLLTLELFQQGKNIEEIASERGLSKSTIEGHIARFIASGDIDIHKIMNTDDLDILIPYFTANRDILLKDAFEHFEMKYSYGMLRIVEAFCKNKE